MKPSRQVIPVEIVISLFALSYAWVGGIAWPLEPGLLFHLVGKEGPSGHVAWVFMLGFPSLCLLSFSARELFCWKRCSWSIFEHDASALWRGRMVVWQLYSWLYALHLLLLTERRPTTLVMVTIHAVIGASVCGWSYWENRRVRREIRYATTAYSAVR